MEPLNMKVIDGAIAAIDAEKEESVLHYTLLQALRELKDFKELGLSVEQLREIDRLYADKCREVAEIKMLPDKNQMEDLQARVYDTIEDIGVNRELIYKVDARIEGVPFMKRMETLLTYMLEIKRMRRSTLYRHDFLWGKWLHMLENQKDDLPEVWKDFKRRTIKLEW